QIINLLISQTSSLTRSVAVIGIGSGIDLEMLLLSLKSSNIIAYDISLSDFTKFHFEKKVELREAAFENESSLNFGAVVAIELLEHLHNPYKLIKEVADSLSPGGHFIFTTATNMPQFDHLYNFTNDDVLDNYLKEVGLRITFKEELFHHYMKEQAPSKNTFYVTTKF
ncbi:MAG: methyltransferase domain-containing protein, partial [Cyclobacteriaceae bacterium]